MQNHILPIFGEMKINKITKANILDWQTSLNGKGFAQIYKTKLRGILSTILKFGMQYYDLPSNVVSLVEKYSYPTNLLAV